MQKVFIIDAKDYVKLDRLLCADPFADGSFKKNGYTLKESKALGLAGGSYVLFFESNDDSLARTLAEKLTKEIPDAKEPDSETSGKIAAQIKKEEDDAATGFGAIFG